MVHYMHSALYAWCTICNMHGALYAICMAHYTYGALYALGTICLGHYTHGALYAWGTTLNYMHGTLHIEYYASLQRIEARCI